MEGFELLVTPEVLESKSAEVEKKVNNVKEKFAKMNDMIDATKEYWVGEGGDKHRETYGKFRNDIDDIIKRLSEHPAELLTMAGIYRQSEQTNVSSSNSLDNNVIQ